MRQTLSTIGIAMLAGLFVVSLSALHAEDEKPEFDGSVEVLYRNVSQDGSAERYNEDFDGLDSGMRLSNLRANWTHIDSGLLDYLRLEASGLGGDPYERTALRLGRKDLFDLKVSHWKQTFLYNLFETVDDQDGSFWDTERRKTDIDLTWHATPDIDVFFEYQNVNRDGTSLFMKSINTDLFRLETPMDQEVKRYSIGARFRLGPADFLLRHTLRRYDYRFDNSTTGDLGLSTDDTATLDSYDWRQRDRGDADLTTLTVNLPLSPRIHLSATAFGTFIGEEEIASRVSLDAEGTSFRGRCAVTGTTCSGRVPCDTGIPGNVCVGAPFDLEGGQSTADIEADYTVLDSDLSITIVEPLDFHLQVHAVEREVDARHLRDLDGDGAADDTEGIVLDSTPGSVTTVDYSLRSITGLFDYAPWSKLRMRAGYRVVDRDLDRSGFEYGTNDARNLDHESESDDTLVLGFDLEPIDWFQLRADYEQDDIDQAFTAVAPVEVDRLRVRANFVPKPEMRIDLSYLDYENTNDGTDFRRAVNCDTAGTDAVNGCWSSVAEGTTYSVSFWHKANPKLDYWFRWALQDFDRKVRSAYDLELFGFTENGDSIYDSERTEWAGRVRYRWNAAWDGFVRFQLNDSDGSNDLVGATFANSLILDQDFSDVEVGLTHTLPGGYYLGARYRVFDYDDFNDRQDYDGEIFSFVAGLDF